MGRRVRPHRYARRRLHFQLAAYRLLVFDICLSFFVKLIEAPKRFAGTYTRYSSRNEDQWNTLSHTSRYVKRFTGATRARNIY